MNFARPPAAPIALPLKKNNNAEESRAIQQPGVYRARLYRHYKELEAIWRALESTGHCTVFQTYDWAACWYDSVTAHVQAEPLIVTVIDDNGKPIWILPLCLYRKKGLRIISFADLGVADYIAPVIAPRAPTEQGEIQAMLKTVLKTLPPCDLVYFKKMPPLAEGLSNPLLYLHRAILFPVVRFPADCYGIKLCKSWPALAEEIMQPRLRATIRKQKKAIEKQGAIMIEHENFPSAMGPLWDRLLQMRRARFNAIGRPDMPALWQDFYRALATRPGRALDVSITTMTISGEAVATCYGLTRNGAYHAILPTFAIGTWERFRPGMLLYNEMLGAHAEKTKRRGYFDFTIGDEVYKKRFGSENHLLYEWMAPRSLPGWLAYTAWRTKIAIRRYPRLFMMAKHIKHIITKKC